jgi:hypothetical protein
MWLTRRTGTCTQCYVIRTEGDENTKGATLDNTFVCTIFAREMLCPRDLTRTVTDFVTHRSVLGISKSNGVYMDWIWESRIILRLNTSFYLTGKFYILMFYLAFHSRFNRWVQINHPNIWSFIRFLQGEENRFHERYYDGLITTMKYLDSLSFVVAKRKKWSFSLFFFLISWLRYDLC